VLSIENISKSRNLQQHRSLQGRWYNRPQLSEDVNAEDQITRGRIFRNAGCYWLVLSIFKKGYGKFRLTRSVAAVEATDTNKNWIRFHAVQIRRSAIRDVFALCSPDIRDSSTCRNHLLNIRASEVEAWTNFYVEYRT
jgi:hypothetical protein